MSYPPTPTARAPAVAADVASRRRILHAETILLAVAGLVAAVSAYSPWWYLSNTSGSSSVVEYYPGSEFYAGGGGGGGTVPYSAYGLSGVGELYQAVLVGMLLVTLVAWVLGGYAFALSRGHATGGEARHLAAAARFGTIGLALALAVGVPLLQPYLYSAADPGGSCSAAPAQGPCSGFWGSLSSASGGSVWGAGAGWWLDVAVAGLLLFALALAVAAGSSEGGALRSRSDPGTGVALP